MATENHSDSTQDIAWKMTLQLSALRCAYTAVSGLQDTLRVGMSVEMAHLEDLTAANIVFRGSIEALEELRSRVDALPTPLHVGSPAAAIPMEIQQRFDQAVPLIHDTLAILEKAQGLAEADSESECRCHEALQELQGALRTIERREAEDAGV
jgi:hypothetical protein